MLGKSLIISGVIVGTLFTVDAKALEFMSDDSTVINAYSGTESDKADDGGFFSDDVFILAKYQEEKKIAEEKKKEEEAKKKAEEEAKKRSMVSYAPSSSNFKTPELNTSQVGSLRLAIHNDDYDTMVRKVNSMLAGKGMAGQGVHVVNAGIANNIDPYIITAISITESTGGTYTIRPYNAWGRKTRTGWMSWSNWEEAIHNQAQYLANNYLNIGLTTLESIGKKYCPPTYKDWANKVRRYQIQTANR